jgi:hypothetical protein
MQSFYQFYEQMKYDMAMRENNSDYANHWAYLHYLDTDQLLDMLPKPLAAKFWNKLHTVNDDQEEKKLRYRIIDMIMDKKYGTEMPSNPIKAASMGRGPHAGHVPSDYGDNGLPSEFPHFSRHSGPGANYNQLAFAPDRSSVGPMVRRGRFVAGGE